MSDPTHPKQRCLGSQKELPIFLLLFFFFFSCWLFPLTSLAFSTPQLWFSSISVKIPFLYLSPLHSSFSFPPCQLLLLMEHTYFFLLKKPIFFSCPQVIPCRTPASCLFYLLALYGPWSIWTMVVSMSIIIKSIKIILNHILIAYGKELFQQSKWNVIILWLCFTPKEDQSMDNVDKFRPSLQLQKKVVNNPPQLSLLLPDSPSHNTTSFVAMVRCQIALFPKCMTTF